MSSRLQSLAPDWCKALSHARCCKPGERRRPQRGCARDNTLAPLAPSPFQQIVYKVFEPSELKPVLEEVNADMTKEKEKEKSK